MVSAMLVPSPSVDCCRTRRSTKMTGDASEEAVLEIRNVRTSNSAEDHGGRALSEQEQQVATSASTFGPSKKGPGH